MAQKLGRDLAAVSGRISMQTVNICLADTDFRTRCPVVCVPLTQPVVPPPLLMRPMSEGRKEKPLKSAILKSVYYDLS
ncbi:hypothetical protein TNCV_2850111 [Trichonephila clavipes]|nr:hypothetical protein TNCV_2850111 [Trichonephila clavipes]